LAHFVNSGVSGNLEPALNRMNTNSKMKNNLLILFASTLMFTICNGQTKAIGDGPLNLETFNFDTKISDLYPERNKSKDYKGVYEIKGALHSQMVEKDTTYINEYSANKKAVGIQYLQKSSTSIDEMAFFENQKFQKINVATTLNGKIKAINAVADELTEQKSAELLKKLANKYGKPKKLKNSWDEKFTIYEWTAKNRIIRYVSAYDDESTTMKIVINEEKQTISSGNKEPHYVGYLFIINPALKSEVFGKIKTGDFVYLDEKTK
jgi:hypothetical protein